MSDEASPRQKPRLLAAMVVGMLVLLALVGYFIIRNPYETLKPDTDKPTRLDEKFLAQARSQLAKKTDLATCRIAVQLLDNHLQKAKEKPPEIAPVAANRLRDQLGLTPEEVVEVSAPSYTTLDAHHLDSCFLFRDVARSLELPTFTEAEKSAKPMPLDYAVAGFDWVVRQVRLPDPKDAATTEQAPPAAILRRGVGSALQRAQVFLALLEQFGLAEADTSGLQGCLVYRPDEKGVSQFWACGVAIGTKPDSLYLFDPRVGLPIPAPGGKGVATLAQASSDASVLAQWKLGTLAYDVTPAQAKDASALVVVPLSAATPRMRFLQDRLLRDRTLDDQPLPAEVRVRLAEDPDQALAIIRTALGKPDGVQLWREGAGLLRRFIPSTDGGGDKPGPGMLPAQVRFQFDAIPWGEYPAILNQGEEMGPELIQKLRMAFALPFLRALVDAKSPRELLLRGRFVPAVNDLVREQEQLQNSRSMLQQATNLGPEINQWIKESAVPAFAEASRARGGPNEMAAKASVEQLWRWKLGDPIEVLVNGSVAGPRGSEVMYQLALTRHEQAIRFQSRVDLAATIGRILPADAKGAKDTWLDAEFFWNEFLHYNPTRPGVASAQRLLGEALVRLGKQAEAVKVWQDTSAPQSGFERIGRLWLAR